ncbi:MAG: DegT/DnrJ/EryC1/StrS family aminotransferase [Candidatus Eisenbacteria bacterium]
MTDPILVFDLKPQIAALRPELDRAIARVLDRGWFILGEEVRTFEEAFARYLGLPYLLGVANGTDAIQLALRAVGVGAGDADLIPPSTANPTACAISAVRARPVFADVERTSGLFDLDAVEGTLAREAGEGDRAGSSLRPRATARSIAPPRGAPRGGRDRGCRASTRRAGRGADGGRTRRDLLLQLLPKQESRGLRRRRRPGGHARPTLAERLRLLRNYGQADRYQHVTFGLNSRLDELQAAILGVKLPHLERWNDARRSWRRYRERLAGLPLVLPPPDGEGERSIHHLFVVRVAERDSFREKLRAAGIAAEVHYPY